MTFPASQRRLQREFENAMDTTLSVQANVTRVRDDSAAGAIPRQEVLSIQRLLASAIGIWNAASGTAGMAQYARDQLDDQALNIGTEFTAMIAAAGSFRDWINTNLPRDSGSQAVLLQTADANGVRADLTFTSTQLSGFRTEADAFLATVS